MIIQNKKIGVGEKTFFIADIAANHDGDINRALELIKLCAEAGADAAKFQHFKAETIVSDFGFKNLGSQQSHQKKWSKSVYEVYKDASLNLEWTEKLKEECDKMSNVDCANLVTEENKGIIARIAEIAKAIGDAADNSADAQKKREAQVKIDTFRKKKMKEATDGENVVNSPLMDRAITDSNIPKS